MLNGMLTSWNLLYVVDLAAITHFIVSYYLNCYRKGYRLDFWHVQLFLLCVFPNMIMLPFAKSELNRIVVGKDLNGVVGVLPFVFLITMAGYVAVLVGGSLWKFGTGMGMRNLAGRALEIVPRCSLMLMSSKNILIFQAALCLFLQFLILAFYFSQNGLAFDLRSFTFENPAIRPIALVISNYSIIVASHSLARYIDKKERILLACTLFLSFGLIFFGARGNLLSIYSSVLLCYVVKLRKKIGLTKIVSLAVLIIMMAFYLGNARAGEYSLSSLFGSLVFLVFYGNTFSDLRDFAWVYSDWNHAFWAGRTYLAAALAFVPRFASQFRDTWALGVVTASTVGFDPQVHPGLRPGAFGEGFFNFGLIGVIVVGLILGFVSKYVDMQVKQAFSLPTSSMMKAFAPTMLLGLVGVIAVSAGFSGVYVLGGVYFFSWLCITVERVFRPHGRLIESENEL